MAASASRRISIFRKTRSVFRNNSIVSCFWLFILLVLEYCSPVWMCAAVSYLSLLDRVVLSAFRLSGGVVRCDLWSEAETQSCRSSLCSIAFVVLLVIRWGSYFFSCLRLVVLRALILPCTPSLLCVLDISPRSTCVRFFLLVFRYGICLMNQTLLTMVWEPSRQLWIVPLGYGLINLYIFRTYTYFLSRSFLILDSF